MREEMHESAFLPVIAFSLFQRMGVVLVGLLVVLMWLQLSFGMSVFMSVCWRELCVSMFFHLLIYLFMN